MRRVCLAAVARLVARIVHGRCRQSVEDAIVPTLCSRSELQHLREIALSNVEELACEQSWIEQ